MIKYRLDIEYSGTQFRGWQIQASGKTVQGSIIAACKQIFNTEKIVVQGGGRTDAGVHALSQTAHLEAPSFIPPDVLQLKINDLLPSSVSILQCEKVAANFHARHHAIARSYLYVISTRRTAFGKELVWWIKDQLDVEKMSAACNTITGFHDFKSFTNAVEARDEKSTLVNIHSAELSHQGDLIVFRICASHFLWKMVRRITGVLTEVGRGNLRTDVFSELLKAPSDTPAKLTAPPSGLYLEKIYYKGDVIPSGVPVFNILRNSLS